MVKNEVGSFINGTIYHGRKFLFGFRNSGNSFGNFIRCNFIILFANSGYWKLWMLENVCSLEFGFRFLEIEKNSG